MDVGRSHCSRRRRLLDDGSNLIECELGPSLVIASKDRLAAADDLEKIRAGLDLLSRRLAYFGVTIGLSRVGPSVPTRDRNELSSANHLRTRDQSGLNGVAQIDVHMLKAPDVPASRDASSERTHCLAGAPQRHRGTRRTPGLVILQNQCQVGVEIDQPRHYRATARVDALRVKGVGGHLANRADSITLNHHVAGYPGTVWQEDLSPFDYYHFLTSTPALGMTCKPPKEKSSR
jgi:hypothetical protein